MRGSAATEKTRVAAPRSVAAGVGVAIAVGVAVVGVATRDSGGGRAGRPVGATVPSIVAGIRPRAPAPRQTPFTHPLLAGATIAAAREDCSRSALGAVVERTQAIEAKSDPIAGVGGSKRAALACPSPAAGETERMLRGELLPRVATCVARDTPLDPQWDVVHAAVSSLGVCLDCTRPKIERAAQCQRSRQLLADVGNTER